MDNVILRALAPFHRVLIPYLATVLEAFSAINRLECFP